MISYCNEFQKKRHQPTTPFFLILGSVLSFSITTRVLLLSPEAMATRKLYMVSQLCQSINVCLNFKYLTGFVVQQRRIRISSAPRLVISFLSFAVSAIREIALYPSKLQGGLYAYLFCRRMRLPS